DGAQQVDGGERAQPEVHGVAEGEQARLAQEHVEGEREDGADADLAQEREPESLRGEERREQDHRERSAQSDQPVPGEERLHVSRAAIRPRGRRMRSTTIRRYGMIGASCVKDSRASAGADCGSWCRARSRSTNDQSSPTMKVCRTPMSSEATNAPPRE